MWTDRRLLDRLGLRHPIFLAPMGNYVSTDLAVAVMEAGGLGAVGSASRTPEDARTQFGRVRQRASGALNANFFCHKIPAADPAREVAWNARMAPYFAEFGADPAAQVAGRPPPFGDAMCDVVEEFRPEVVSFHFGLPEQRLVDRVKATGALLIASATTVAEARWLEDHGCDAIIAQGAEAGGHRGFFLNKDISGQPGTMALVPQVVDAVRVPVIAAGGIMDGRGLAAALMLGAAAAQIGTAYLFTPEADVPDAHRAALRGARDDATRLTNVFTGGPARCLPNRALLELGPMSAEATAFPGPSATFQRLRAGMAEEAQGDFIPLFAGQAAALGREIAAGELTTAIAREAARRLGLSAA